MLTYYKKICFVATILRDAEYYLIQAIRDNKIPEDWDGLELRVLIAQYFAEQASNINTPKRKREVENIRIVNNI